MFLSVAQKFNNSLMVRKCYDNQYFFFLYQGPYGSGKTIVCQKILENILPALDEDKDVLFYIIFDQYSLLYAETYLYCENLKKKYSNIEIICWNISEVDTDPSSLSECLKKLTQISADKGKRLHIFIDEYDGEDLTEDECILLKDVIGKIGSLIIVIQSILKYRSLHDVTSANSIKISTHTFNVLKGSMKFLHLTKVMRFTESIFDVNQNVQGFVTAKENKYHEPGNILYGLQNHTPTNNLNDLQNHEAVTYIYDDHDVVQAVSYDSTDGKPIPDNGNNSSNNVKVPIDRLIKQINSGGQTKHGTASDLIVGTKFNFHEAKGCGHAIKGSIPSLIRIPQNHPTVYQLVESAILKVSKPCYERSLFICNDIWLLDILYTSILNLNLEVIVHVSGLTEEEFNSNDMISLYNQWIDTPSGCVLLTDNMGCRGLQNENVWVCLLFI